ncbi:hypothetical protein SAMN05216474_0664 [Lishizhenia tianjinensis]|uniref:Lipoprotein n=1 Tax=Lishizhenia tianjinensis TaxID=477690 RepID=A0A1I6Y551_9FLAO|nr:hypothetical protein [Lishizhenia tianjinensis]SFT45606.1 hypothetical protein SAMN05216474_0664 [Lishizhenia tianjinensis]
MKRYNVLLACSLALLTITACSKKAEVEAVDYKDIMPTSEREYQEGLERDTLEHKEVFYLANAVKEDSLLLENVQGLQLKKLTNDFAYFPDRLNYSQKWARVGNLDSLKFTVVKWTFSDSVLTENAFFNWLDCFGERCASVRVGEDANFSDLTIFLEVTQREILFASSSEIEDLAPIVEVLKDELLGEDKYILEQKSGKKANWLVLPADVKGTPIQSDL